MQNSIILNQFVERTDHQAVITFVEANERLLENGAAIDEVIQRKLVNIQQMLRAYPYQDGSEQIVNRISRLERQISLQERASQRYTNYEDLFQGFSEIQAKHIIPNITTIQLTKGCSLACPNCNFNALIAPRAHLSWELVTKLIDILPENWQGFFYYASDPLNWQDGDKNYLHVLEYAAEKRTWGPSVETTTAIPKGKEQLALAIWKSDFNIRFSLSNVNFHRLEKLGIVRGNTYEEIVASIGEPGNKRSKVIDLPSAYGGGQNLMYEVGLSYDFRSYQPSIGCRHGVLLTPDGFYNMASTATTPTTPNGFIQEKITPQSSWILTAGRDHDEHFPLVLKSAVRLDSGKEIKVPLSDFQVIEAIYEAIILTNWPGGYQIEFIENWTRPLLMVKTGHGTRTPKKLNDLVGPLWPQALEMILEENPGHTLALGQKLFRSALKEWTALEEELVEEAGFSDLIFASLIQSKGFTVPDLVNKKPFLHLEEPLMETRFIRTALLRRSFLNLINDANEKNEGNTKNQIDERLKLEYSLIEELERGVLNFKKINRFIKPYQETALSDRIIKHAGELLDTIIEQYQTNPSVRTSIELMLAAAPPLKQYDNTKDWMLDCLVLNSYSEGDPLTKRLTSAFSLTSISLILNPDSDFIRKIKEKGLPTLEESNIEKARLIGLPYSRPVAAVS